jgi:hypothetical protein
MKRHARLIYDIACNPPPSFILPAHSHNNATPLYFWFSLCCCWCSSLTRKFSRKFLILLRILTTPPGAGSGPWDLTNDDDQHKLIERRRWRRWNQVKFYLLFDKKFATIAYIILVISRWKCWNIRAFIFSCDASDDGSPIALIASISISLMNSGVKH